MFVKYKFVNSARSAVVLAANAVLNRADVQYKFVPSGMSVVVAEPLIRPAVALRTPDNEPTVKPLNDGDEVVRRF